METLVYADPTMLVRIFWMAVALFVLVGLLGGGVLMRWIRGREQWSAEPPRPKLALFVVLVCTVVIPLAMSELIRPVDFHQLQIGSGVAKFHRVLPTDVRTVPLATIVRVEFLANGRLAFWLTDPEGPWTEEDLEVTTVIFRGDQKDRFAETVAALEAAGWTGAAGASHMKDAPVRAR